MSTKVQVARLEFDDYTGEGHHTKGTGSLVAHIGEAYRRGWMVQGPFLTPEDVAEVRADKGGEACF